MSDANAAAVQEEEPLHGWEAITPQDTAAYLSSCSGDEPYELGSDALRKADVPRGTITQHEWSRSEIYPLTHRSYWVYVPTQYDPGVAANLIVFQDGQAYLGPECAATVVLDNLIASGDIPPTIGVFVEPGAPGPGVIVYGGTGNRTVEYDSMNGDFAAFLADEILAEVGAELNISDDPSQRAIIGHSSGGICAFTAAWFRPDLFGNVISHCGAFVDLLGGHEYPARIRRERVKPVRIFLQTGTNDLNVALGDFELANRQIASALAYRGYDHQFVVGVGGHTMLHGGALFPETLRWLWGR